MAVGTIGSESVGRGRVANRGTNPDDAVVTLAGTTPRRIRPRPPRGIDIAAGTSRRSRGPGLVVVTRRRNGAERRVVAETGTASETTMVRLARRPRNLLRRPASVPASRRSLARKKGTGAIGRSGPGGRRNIAPTTGIERRRKRAKRTRRSTRRVIGAFPRHLPPQKADPKVIRGHRRRNSRRLLRAAASSSRTLCTACSMSIPPWRRIFPTCSFAWPGAPASISAR